MRDHIAGPSNGVARLDGSGKCYHDVLQKHTAFFACCCRSPPKPKTSWMRGALVVDQDLFEAVSSKTIAAAVLDVFRKEPLPSDHPFWTTPGITVLPHIGGLHPARDEGVAEVFVANARRFLAGEPLVTVVDRARGY